MVRLVCDPVSFGNEGESMLWKVKISNFEGTILIWVGNNETHGRRRQVFVADSQNDCRLRKEMNRRKHSKLHKDGATLVLQSMHTPNSRVYSNTLLTLPNIGIISKIRWNLFL